MQKIIVGYANAEPGEKDFCDLLNLYFQGGWKIVIGTIKAVGDGQQMVAVIEKD